MAAAAEAPSSPPRVAVVVATYRRSDGSTPDKLRRMFGMLERQTHRDFTLFLIGDDYADDAEFRAVAEAYRPRDRLRAENRPESLRSLRLGKLINYWACGGTLAIRRGYELARETGHDLALMLDDDDEWAPDHVQRMVRAHLDFPDAALLTACARYVFGNFLPMPPKSADPPACGNWTPEAGKVVRSATAHNLRLMFDYQQAVWDRYLRGIRRLDQRGGAGGGVAPQDATVHMAVAARVRAGDMRCVCVPHATVRKRGDVNTATLGIRREDMTGGARPIESKTASLER